MNRHRLNILGRKIEFCDLKEEGVHVSNVTVDQDLMADSVYLLNGEGSVLCRFYKPLEDMSKLYLTYPKTNKKGTYVTLISGTEELHEPVKFLGGEIAIVIERTFGETKVTVAI